MGWGQTKTGRFEKRWPCAAQVGRRGLAETRSVTIAARRSPPKHATPAAAMSCEGMCVRPRGMRPKNSIEASQINDRPPKK